MPMEISQEQINKLAEESPELPHVKRERYVAEYGLPEYDSEQLTLLKATAEYFEGVMAAGAAPKAAANWIMGDVWRVMKEKYMEIEQLPFTPQQLADMIAEIEKGTISNTAAKQVLEEMLSLIHI